MISIRSGVLVAVNRPPGCGSISAIWLSGFAGSGFGLLGLTDATSKEDGAAGACAAIVAPGLSNRIVATLKAIIRFIISSSTLRMTDAAQRPGCEDAEQQRQQCRRQDRHRVDRRHPGQPHPGQL